MQISNEGLTRMTLGQLLELGLHGKLSPPLLQNSINAFSFASRKYISENSGFVFAPLMIDHKISDHLLIKSKCSSVPLLNEPLFLIVYAWGWVRSSSFKGYKMKPKLGQKHASSIAW